MVVILINIHERGSDQCHLIGCHNTIIIAFYLQWCPTFTDIYKPFALFTKQQNRKRLALNRKNGLQAATYPIVSEKPSVFEIFFFITNNSFFDFFYYKQLSDLRLIRWSLVNDLDQRQAAAAPINIWSLHCDGPQ